MISQGYNYVTDDSCGLLPQATCSRVRSRSSVLANNGGPTLSVFGSSDPLLDHIPLVSCQDGIGTGITTDRAASRSQGVGCDVGAVEVAIVPVTPVAPDTPETPETPAVPETLETPGTAETPETLAAPEAVLTSPRFAADPS